MPRRAAQVLTRRVLRALVSTGTVTLTWSAIDATGTIYTGYRVAVQGTNSPPEKYVASGTLTATFSGVTAGTYVGQVQLSVEDMSEVDTATIRLGDVSLAPTASVTVNLT